MMTLACLYIKRHMLTIAAITAPHTTVLVCYTKSPDCCKEYAKKCDLVKNPPSCSRSHHMCSPAVLRVQVQWCVPEIPDGTSLVCTAHGHAAQCRGGFTAKRVTMYQVEHMSIVRSKMWTWVQFLHIPASTTGKRLHQMKDSLLAGNLCLHRRRKK